MSHREKCQDCQDRIGRPTLEHPNHPTIIFSEFMGKEWRKVQTDGGKGVGSEGCDQELPCHMIQQIGASITQETGAGRVMRVD